MPPPLWPLSGSAIHTHNIYTHIRCTYRYLYSNKSPDICYRQCTGADILAENLYCPIGRRRAGGSHPIPSQRSWTDVFYIFFAKRNAAWHTPRVMSNLRRTADALRTNNCITARPHSPRIPTHSSRHIPYTSATASDRRELTSHPLSHPHYIGTRPSLPRRGPVPGDLSIYLVWYIYRYFTPGAHFLNIYIYIPTRMISADWKRPSRYTWLFADITLLTDAARPFALLV